MQGMAFMEWIDKIGKIQTQNDLLEVCEEIFEDERLTRNDQDVLEFLAIIKEWDVNWSQKKNSG